MNVLVVGGAGFVGSHIVEAFAREGHVVRSLSRRAPRFGEIGGVDYIIGDAGRTEDLARCVAGSDVVVFSATATTPASAHSDPEFDLASSVLSGMRVLNAAMSERVKHVMLISSAGTVYGIPQSLPINESHQTNPISTYGVSRLTLEKYFGVFCFHTRISTTILRVGNAVGERQAPDSGQGAAAAFLASLLSGEPVEIWGDGSVVRDYIYAGDVARACLRAALLSDRTQGGNPLVVNIGSGQGTSLLDLIGMCSRVVGRNPLIVRMPGRRFDVPAIVLDVNRAREALGWRPETPLHVGLERAATWLATAVEHRASSTAPAREPSHLSSRGTSA